MNPEREIRKLLEEYIKVKDNLILSERFFVGISVLNWAYVHYKEREVLAYYLDLVKRHINSEITLYWEKGVVKITRGKK